MNKLLMTTTSLLAGAALVLGGVVAANASTATATSTSTANSTPVVSAASSCTFGEYLVSAWFHVPKAMRADLRAARAKTLASDRRAALKAIRTKALDGGYGAGVGDQAKWLKSHKAAATGIRPLPAELKADLKTLHSEKGKAAKLAEANTIASKAVAGRYGAKIETLAKGLKASSVWQDCTPAVTGR
jgi:hypothetical protein